MCFTRDEIRWKGFRRGLLLAEVPHCASENVMKHTVDTKPRLMPIKPQPEVIAIRKTCDAEGTGLSHYVLMDKQAKK